MNLVKNLLCSAICAGTAMSANAAFVGDRADFRDETIYFAMTTRFYDGDKSNNTYCWDGTLNVDDPEWRGDFKGLIEKLDYIKALGFTAVWITPVVENCSGLDYHGYHAMNFSKVDPRYESEDVKFQDVIDAVHDHGMKIILDIVLQHTGNFGEDYLCPEFEKDYTQPLSNINKCLTLHPNSQLPSNYYNLASGEQYQARLSLMKNNDNSGKDSHNYWHHVGSAWDWDDYSRVWGQIAGDCVDLNTENPHVYNYIIDCYSKFIEMGVDGFRVDTSGHVARITFNKAFVPGLMAAAEKYKAKRNNAPFYMFGEVCARAEEVIYRNQNYNCSPCFYTWAETKDYGWDSDESSWDGLVYSEVNPSAYSNHTNTASVLAQATDYEGHADGILQKSTNAWLTGNDYHTPDYSKSSNFNVIDFPMHWRFHDAENAFGVRSQDNLYNDATWNVVYVDGHDYGPNGWDTKSFGGSQAEWAENLDLMFTWRGIPCIWQGTEVYFRKGNIIDKGAIEALNNTARAYFGGYITGSVNTTDFATYTNATGNMAASLSHPLALHLQRLNKIRAAVPALRKGQYSTDGCSGKMAFKRRYTDDNVDSYVLVTISGSSTFTGILNGTYTDAITGDVKEVTNNTLTATCSGQGNARIYVLTTSKTAAPGKVGDDGKFLYTSSSVTVAQEGYDGHEEDGDTETQRDSGSGSTGGTVTEPETPTEPAMAEGEQAVFFENTSSWSGTINAYVWSSSSHYTGSWPGMSMTYLGNKIWKWTYTGTDKIPDDAGVIFNNGGSQTADLKWVNGGYYNANGYVKTIEGAGEIPDTPATPSEPVTGDWVAYFDNTGSNWSSVYAWVWDKNNGNQNYTGGSWPGQKLSIDEESGYYKFACTVTASSPSMMIIFNNGSGTQTADLTFVNTGIYTANGYSGQNFAGIADAAIAQNIKVYTKGGELVIESAEATTVTIARIDGVTFTTTVGAGVNHIALPRGFYIIGHQKIVL